MSFVWEQKFEFSHVLVAGVVFVSIAIPLYSSTPRNEAQKTMRVERQTKKMRRRSMEMTHSRERARKIPMMISFLSWLVRVAWCVTAASLSSTLSFHFNHFCAWIICLSWSQRQSLINFMIIEWSKTLHSRWVIALKKKKL